MSAFPSLDAFVTVDEVPQTRSFKDIDVGVYKVTTVAKAATRYGNKSVLTMEDPSGVVTHCWAPGGFETKYNAAC